jgi:hypothetical protein
MAKRKKGSRCPYGVKKNGACKKKPGRKRRRK